MDKILPFYNVDPVTWFYLSFLLIVAVYFRFNRLWSLRNFDLALLLSISPALLFVQAENQIGYIWLFIFSGVLLLRLMTDRLFRSRPRIEQNLNTWGSVFLCFSTLLFLMTKVATEKELNTEAARIVDVANKIVAREQNIIVPGENSPNDQQELRSGPAAPVLIAPAAKFAKVVSKNQEYQPTGSRQVLTIAVKFSTILAHLAVVFGLFWMGRQHFGDAHIGVGMATLYLLLPLTAYEVTRLNHVLPSALVLWAVISYKKPWISGLLMGLACGTLFYPIFLLPIWMVFYGRRGLKFAGAIGASWVLISCSLLMTSVDFDTFRQQLVGSFDRKVLSFNSETAEGFWAMYESAYQIPVFVSFLLMVCVLSFWPRKKNLEQLLAYSVAIIVGMQFWYPYAGGANVLWYLPLLLLVVFRPKINQSAQTDRQTQVAHSANVRTTLHQERELAATGSGHHSLFR